MLFSPVAKDIIELNKTFLLSTGGKRGGGTTICNLEGNSLLLFLQPIITLLLLCKNNGVICFINPTMFTKIQISEYPVTFFIQKSCYNS